ncbi:MAG: N-acetyltransferase [Bacillota bacterium]|nr:N-acetyltransferase [Bacillota bacterium]
MIRKMKEADIEALRILDKLCFKTKTLRRIELMESFINENASLVYEHDGKIIGYIFNHVLGNFGWFGTFGVHPDYRSSHIGKRLINETINIFHNEFKVKNIGLVTMPDSAYNIGFYMNLGFKPERLSLRLCKDVNKDIFTEDESLKNFKIKFVDMKNEIEYKNIMTIAKEISENIYSGMDMSPELYQIEKNNMGTGFIVYEDKKPVGFGVLRNKNVFEVEDTYAHIKLLCLNSEVLSYKKAVDAVLCKTYEYAVSNGLSEIFIDINTFDYDLCSHLIKEHCFKIDRSSLTLIMGDLDFYSNMNGIVMFRTAT